MPLRILLDDISTIFVNEIKYRNIHKWHHGENNAGFKIIL